MMIFAIVLLMHALFYVLLIIYEMLVCVIINYGSQMLHFVLGNNNKLLFLEKKNEVKIHQS